MSKELDVAIRAAKIAGERLEEHFETILELHEKEDKSFVTKADLEAEKIIVEQIQKNFPGHQILSEEAGTIGEADEHVWMIDPLDGTNNFTRGIPIFATSIALTHKKETTMAVVYNSITNTLFTAEKGAGAFWNGEKIEVSDIGKVSDCTLSFSRGRDSKSRALMLDLFDKVYPKIKSPRVLSSASLELAYVASGRLDAFIIQGINIWDFLGGLLLVEEAGGKTTTLDGGGWNLKSSQLLVTNGTIHEELLEILNR
ncbi:MAG: inositol monophosphatase [Candidatus Woykebacteria bacterium]